ncbi:MAG TPA: DUF998 domain-containing protein [Clostridia bacterium]|nr:DUF998 domain-containing protein [Clostridia bacterium]
MNRIKKALTDFKYILYASLLLFIVMLALPFFSAESYSIIKNTTSQLGAQNTVNAWIMNVTFIIVGVSCIAEAWLHLKQFWFQKIVLSIFGLGLIFTGLFSHAPITDTVVFNPIEDQLHSVFASAVGFSFIIYAISSAFIENKKTSRILDLSVGLSTAALSLLMLFYPDFLGIWQRTMFIISFIWLIFMLERIKNLDKNVLHHNQK